MEGVEHQQGVLELLAGFLGKLGIVEQFDQSGDVVATLHGAQQLDGMHLVDERRFGFALGQGGQETGLDIGGLVHPGRNAVGQQIEDSLFFSGGRRLEQFDQFGDLFGVQRLGGNAFLGTLFDMLAIGFKHVGALIGLWWSRSNASRSNVRDTLSTVAGILE